MKARPKIITPVLLLFNIHFFLKEVLSSGEKLICFLAVAAASVFSSNICLYC